jgi:hypothetical protein
MDVNFPSKHAASGSENDRLYGNLALQTACKSQSSMISTIIDHH